MTGSRCSYQIGAQSIINQDRALLVIGFTSVTRSWLSYMYNTLYIYIFICVCVCVRVSNSNWNCIPKQKRGIPWGIAAKNPSIFFGFHGDERGVSVGLPINQPRVHC